MKTHKIGQFTKEHFISFEAFVRKKRRGNIRKKASALQHNGRLYWGALGGVEV